MKKPRELVIVKEVEEGNIVYITQFLTGDGKSGFLKPEGPYMCRKGGLLQGPRAYIGNPDIEENKRRDEDFVETHAFRLVYGMMVRA
jgi:hypothetical protein